MAFILGQIDQWSDANSIMDPEVLIAAQAIQLGMQTGAFYQSMVPPVVGLDNTTFEIYSRSKTTKSGVMGSVAAASGDATISINSAYINGLTNGHVIQIDDEVMVIDEVNTTTNVITPYTRGAASTTAAAHLSGSAFSVIGYAGKDAELQNVTSSSENTLLYTNYAQTVFETLDYTWQAANLKRKGLSPAQIEVILMNEAMVRVAEYLSKMAILGVKQVGSSAGNPFMGAGLLAQLSDTASATRPVLETDAVSGSITETILNAACKQVFAFGMPDTIWCSPTRKAEINQFNASSSDISVNTDIGASVAGVHVDTFNYDGALLRVRVDADMPDSKIAIVTADKCQKGWLANDAMRAVDEPPASSREIRKSLQGSIGFAIEDVGYSHCVIKNLS